MVWKSEDIHLAAMYTLLEYIKANGVSVRDEYVYNAGDACKFTVTKHSMHYNGISVKFGNILQIGNNSDNIRDYRDSCSLVGKWLKRTDFRTGKRALNEQYTSLLRLLRTCVDFGAIPVQLTCIHYVMDVDGVIVIYDAKYNMVGVYDEQCTTVIVRNPDVQMFSSDNIAHFVYCCDSLISACTNMLTNARNAVDVMDFIVSRGELAEECVVYKTPPTLGEYCYLYKDGSVRPGLTQHLKAQVNLMFKHLVYLNNTNASRKVLDILLPILENGVGTDHGVCKYLMLSMNAKLYYNKITKSLILIYSPEPGVKSTLRALKNETAYVIEFSGDLDSLMSALGVIKANNTSSDISMSYLLQLFEHSSMVKMDKVQREHLANILEHCVDDKDDFKKRFMSFI